MNRSKPVLGRISYSNTLPLFFELICSSQTPYMIKEGVPSLINKLFAEKTVDIALISTYSYLTLKDQCDLIPKYCLSSNGTINSVRLLSQKPIENLNDSRIGLTTQSATSVNILKIILKRFYNILGQYEPLEDHHHWQSQYDAVLLIGDNALDVSGKYSPPFSYDIGELWKHFTGYPIIFAVLAKQKNISFDEYEDVLNWFEKSLNTYNTNSVPIEQYAAIHYDHQINYHDYFSRLEYRFQDNHLKSIELFETYLQEQNLL